MSLKVFCCSILLLSNLAFANFFDEPEGFSGYGRWYLATSFDIGQVEQNLTPIPSFDYQSPRISIGGVGTEAIRFEISWSNISSPDNDWRLTGLEADLWLPWRPERRLRPYLILGVGHHNYYGDESPFLLENHADNGAGSFHVGFALTANLTYLTEIDASIHYRELEWKSHNEDANNLAANASLSSYRITIRRLF